jgi:Cd2+/Zn2+-exporting ATPase
MRTLDMNVLMTTAVLGALAIGKWGEAAAVIVLFALALLLETAATARTRRAIRALLALSPAEAAVERGGGEVTVPVDAVRPGETIVLRPGDRVPLDGTVTGGVSDVDQSTVTGESAPVRKAAGDTVYAGSLNGRGMLRLTVTARHDDTTLARIVHLVEGAQERRAPVQTFVERFAAVYTPAVFAGALLVAILPPLLLGAAWSEWVYRALVLLVIACPCALVISTPVTIVSALTNAARCGVLVKGGSHLEALASVRAVAFDKTGTLTEGRPRVTGVQVLNGMAEGDVLALAAALERHSEHHLAGAILAEARRRDAGPGPEVREFTAIPGRGVEGIVEGRRTFLGSPALGAERDADTASVRTAVERWAAGGATALVLGHPGEPIAVIAVRDGARAGGADAVAALRRLGIQEVAMVTGDHPEPARHIARELAISRVHAGLLPGGKVAHLEEMQREYGGVAMVGDGINDAPALAASSVGVAMGVGGTDAALESSDVVLMADDLRKLPFLFGLSRHALRVIRQNIALALGLKVLFLVLSLTGHATLWMALLADDGAALLVILNGLRALSFKDPT